MTLLRWSHGLIFAGGVLTCAVPSLARATDGPSCKTYDHAAACCPHPPPQCCAPEQQDVDARAITEVCGGAPYKGEAAGLNQCKRYLERGGVIAEVAFGRERGDPVEFARLRAQLAGPRAKVSTQAIAGARQAFVVREVDEQGQPTRAAAWALTSEGIVHVEVERALCDDQQVIRLLERALAPRPAGRPGPRSG